MEVMTGKVLEERLSASASVRMQKRDCFGDVMRYLGSNDNPRILCLYGLWRTGKTVLMEQAMRETGDFGRTLYVIGGCWRSTTWIPSSLRRKATGNTR